MLGLAFDSFVAHESMHFIADEYIIPRLFVGEYGHLVGDWVAYWLVHQ